MDGQENKKENKIPFLLHLDTFFGGVNIVISPQEKNRFEEGSLSTGEIISSQLYKKVGFKSPISNDSRKTQKKLLSHENQNKRR
jgi:hypothetical protein